MFVWFPSHVRLHSCTVVWRQRAKGKRMGRVRRRQIRVFQGNFRGVGAAAWLGVTYLSRRQPPDLGIGKEGGGSLDTCRRQGRANEIDCGAVRFTVAAPLGSTVQVARSFPCDFTGARRRVATWLQTERLKPKKPFLRKESSRVKRENMRERSKRFQDQTRLNLKLR